MYHVTCNTDDKYAQHCIAMLCSLFDNNKEHQICVHVLCNSISEDNKQALMELAKRYNQIICFHSVDETPLEGVQFRSKRPLTKAAYYRLLLSSILSEIDKVLYLDCDMIVLGKINELFDINLNNYALAAVLDPMPYNNLHQTQLQLAVNSTCFCSGIMLINLKYWRDNNIESKLLSFAKQKREPVFLHDQDVLNYVLNNNWFMIPPKWNYNPAGLICSFYYKPFHYTDSIFKPAVIHYCSEIFKPWYNAPCPGSKYYNYYLKLSLYKNPQKQKIQFNKRIYCFYFYILRMLIKLQPLMPRLLVYLISDIFSLLRLLWYIFLSIFKGKTFFMQHISKFYNQNKINI